MTYNVFSLFDDDEDEKEITQPLRLAFFEVRLHEMPLFTSVTYRLITYVDGEVFVESEEVTSKPSQADVAHWTRGVIAQNRHTLKGMNVAVDEVYARFGGNPGELWYM